MRKIPFLRCTTLTIAVLLTGCAVRNPYVSPVSGDTAKVRIINHGNGTTFIHAGENCARSSAKAIAGFSKFLSTDRSRVDMYEAREYENNNDVVERIVEANKEMQLFAVNQGAAGLLITSCNVDVAFLPKKDMQYEVVFNAGLGLCNMALNNLSEIDGKIIKEKTSNVRSLMSECK